MQLKFKRYTGTKGMLKKETTYCLEAVVHPTPEEDALINRFGLWGQMPYIHGELDIDTAETEFTTQIMRVSMRDLRAGARLEYANFNNVGRSEALLANGCKRLLAAANELATFDGSERVVELDERSVEVVAAG